MSILFEFINGVADVEEKRNLLAYCGLYCGDCAGHSGAIADHASNLKEVLEGYKFHLTAEQLFKKQLGDFDQFREKLDFMTGLRCSTVCRYKGEGETPCGIRRCCLEKGYFACNECDTFEECEKLKTLEGLHGDSCVMNLKAINEIGLDAWINSDKRLWFGSET